MKTTFLLKQIVNLASLLLLLDPRFYLFDHGVELSLALFVGLGVDVVGFALDRSYTMTAPKDFYRILKQQDGEVTAFSEKLLCGLPDYATVYADGRLTFTFKKTGPPSRAEPGKCNAPDHRFYRR